MTDTENTSTPDEADEPVVFPDDDLDYVGPEDDKIVRVNPEVAG